MHRRLIKYSGFALFLLALTAARSQAWAQESEDEEQPKLQWAWLTLDLRTHGEARADLRLQHRPKSWEPLRAALGEALHCSAAKFSNPPSEYSDSFLGTMSAKERERYRASLARASQRSLSGNCAGALTGDQWIVHASLDIAPLAEALRTEGVTDLSVRLSYPNTTFHELSREGLEQDREQDFLYNLAFLQIEQGSASYSFTLGQGGPSSPIRIAFGFRPEDLRNAGLIALGFVLFPILIVFWMRRATLKSGSEDTMGAWFSYHRTVNWCVGGAFLLWAFADFGARETLDQFISFRRGQNAILPPLVSAGMIFAPFVIAYAASVALSHQVFVRLRQKDWKLGNYLAVQLLQAGSSVLPLMFVVAGVELLFKHPRTGIVCLLLSYVVYLICSTWRLRVAQTYPQALTAGELRDKIFELAIRAAVSVRQVFVLPAGRGQVANAYAAKTNVVIFTDYLLERLSKREVNAVAAHELTHLQKRHPKKLISAFLAAAFAPFWVPYVGLSVVGLLFPLLGLAGMETGNSMTLDFYRAWGAFRGWPFHNLLLIVLGFSGFYFLARRFEFAADAGAVSLTGDPEAAITALLKLNRLNLVPIQWSKASGAWLTHPMTLHRVERIAEQGGLAPERLRQILEQYNSPTALTASEDHYPTPPASDDQLLSYSAQTSRARFNLWAVIIYHWLPAVATALLVQWRQWEGSTQAAAYLLGLAATLGLYLLAIRWLGVRGRAKLQERLFAKARKEGIPFQDAAPIMVGLSPGATPRFYVASYLWDTGLLFLTRDRLYFLGTQLRCALTRDQVQETRLAPGPPSWVSSPRVYLHWRDVENQRGGVLNLAWSGPSGMWEQARKAQELFERLSQWKQGNVSAAPIPQLDSLSSPALGEVTSQSPKALSSPAKSLRIWLLLVLPVTIAVCVLLRVQAIWYVVLATILVRVFELIPHWRYRERPVFPGAPPQAPPSGPPSISTKQ